MNLDPASEYKYYLTNLVIIVTKEVAIKNLKNLQRRFIRSLLLLHVRSKPAAEGR